MKGLSGPLSQAHALFATLLPELAPALLALAERTGRLLGPYPALERTGREEPDGYDGVGREVHYERLLTSEWLLADEAPDEFWRRAAAGEHAFLSLSRSDPRSERRCFVELDAGPFVLGRPRLVMLALLISLERRAAQAGASFTYRVLANDGPAFEQVDEPSVRAFLASRSPFEPDPNDVRFDVGTDEHWLIGSPRLLSWQRAAGTHVIALEEAWAEPSVALSLHKAGAGPRRALVPMPDDAVCVGLLRNPFRSATVERSQEPAFRGSFAISGRGHRVMEWSDGTVRARAIPARSDLPEGRGRSFRVPADERLLASTYTDRLTTVCAGADYLRVYGLAEGMQDERVHGLPAVTFRAHDLSVSTPPGINECIFLAGARAFKLLLPTVDDVLTLSGPAAPRIESLGARLIASAQSARRGPFLWLLQRGGALEVSEQEGVNSKVLLSFHAQPSRAFFACPDLRSKTERGMLALEQGSELDVLPVSTYSSLSRTRLVIPHGTTCVGVEVPLDKTGPRMLLLESDRRTFVSAGRSAASVLFKSASDVLEARLCPTSLVLAYTTAMSLVLYDLRHRRTLLTWPRQEAP